MALRIRLKAASNKVFLLQEGVLDERALLAFVGGQCHGLALALQRRMGWPLVAVDDADGACVHVCVRDDVGRLVDVTGAHAEGEIAAASGGAVRDIDPSYIDELVANREWAPPDVDGAEAWVDPVLRRAAAGPPLRPMASSTRRKTGRVDDDLEVQIEWSGDPHLDVYVRRVPSPSEAWILYAHVTLPADRETGDHEIDFSAERFEALADAWVRNQFDRAKAERKLQGTSPAGEA